MAYETYYSITFDNELEERVEILLQKKDGVPGTVVQEYAATSVKLTRNAQEEGKFSSIISRELIISFDIRDTDNDYWTDFVNAEFDTWKCIATIETKYVFHGFVMPDEGAVPFQDRPYDATIRATDCLGLLKQQILKNLDDTDFEGEYSIIRYIAAALRKTNLDLPIRVYDNFYESSFLTRVDDLKWDMVSQTYLDYRTFQKDAVTFYNCYEVLDKICKRSFKLFYQQGEWFLVRMGLYQFSATPMYYTVYASDLSTAVGFEETGTYASVGKHELIYPRDEDQIKTVKFAHKSTKTIFNYNIWPELPKNNRFERGALNIPLSGVGYQSYDIDDWEYGIARVGSGNPTFPFPLTPTTASRAYTKRTYNAFGTELTRELIMTKEPGANTQTWLRSAPIPVTQFDKISISLQEKITPDFVSSVGITDAAIVYVTDGITYWGLKNNNGDRILNWKQNSLGFLAVDYFESSAEYSSLSVESPPIPISGNLFIVYPFDSAGLASGSVAHRTGMDIKYFPYTAGGYIEVKGDYWIRSQNLNYPDVSEEEIFLSDSPKKLLKGCLLRADGTPTRPQWNRFGVTEARHYKELINIAEYNHYYRRFWQIEGTFNGTKFSPANDQTNIQPISLHKTYKFVDIQGEERYFMLLTPLEQDLIEAKISGTTFAEVNMVPEGVVPVVETLDSFIFRVISTINSTTESEWDSASGAPPIGTVAFRPSAYLWPSVPNTIAVAINDADNMTTSVSDGGAGNSPSLTEIYNADVGPYRFIQYTFGSDIAIGNEFTFSAYGHDVTITVEGSTVLASADGNQLGDTSSFNYVFQ